MSVEVKFYNFTKDSNSTKQPTSSDLKLTAACEIFEPCNITRPRLIVKVAAPKPTNGYFYNYAYISDFKRYYFITDWQYDTGLWYASLACDVLSTYKSQIGAENMYILRSSAAKNGYIKDNYYPMTAEISKHESFYTPSWSFSGGVYVVNVVGMNTGTSTLYQLTPANFSSFLDALLGVIDNVSFADVMQAIKNAIFDPIKYITSVMWFPSSFTTSGSDTVKVGLWNSNVSASIISDPTGVLDTGVFSLTDHPQVSRGEFLNVYPFSQRVLLYDPFGAIEIDSSKILGDSTIRYYVLMDALTGQGILRVVGGVNGNLLANVTTQLGVPLPLTGASVGSGAITGSVATIGNAVAAAITGDVGLMANAASAGVGTIADAIRGTVSTIGSGGSITALKQTKYLFETFYKVTGDNNAKNGRPYMHSATPAGLGGFMIVQRGDVAIPGTAAEADAIKAILESGFYYE